MRNRLISGVVLVALAASSTLAQEKPAPEKKVSTNEEYPDFYTGSNGSKAKGENFVQAIHVTEPAYRAEVKGDVKIVFKAEGMELAKASCWQQPTESDPSPWGHDVDVLPETKLDEQGNASFVFPADKFPNGPVTIRIYAKNKTKQDICELQLFNTGGVVWNQGIPKEDPIGAKGLTLLYADDFDKPLSLANRGENARYNSHKTGGGDFSGWQFADQKGENQPFGQVGTFMRIRGSKEPGTKGMSGIISSLREDGTGIQTPIPAYFEARLIAHSGPGCWPAFWTLTKGPVGMKKDDPNLDAIKAMGTDELDILEAYGGYGPKNPNGGGIYHSVTHFWKPKDSKTPMPEWYDQKLKDGSPNPKYMPHSFRTDTMNVAGKSSWSWTFHTYGMRIDENDTVYYFDNVEIGRHPTGDVSKKQNHWFLINYAIGGISGWQIDLKRYGDATDMYVDWVRVYHGGGGRVD